MSGASQDSSPPGDVLIKDPRSKFMREGLLFLYLHQETNWSIS
jgi:hypothetical protein